MPRTVTVFDVFIASPADVATERRIVHDAIASWNASHAESNVLLNAVGWETSVSPAFGRSQSIINDILRPADLLIAVFWTRLGALVSGASGGALEEIELHLRENKPAIFYFSSVPVEPSSVDVSQLATLRRFRSELAKRTHVETFESRDDLREKLARQLTDVVETRLLKQPLHTIRPTTSLTAVPPLSKEARSLLSNVARDANGHLLRVRTFGGLTIQTNGQTFGERGEARSEAVWEAALFELRDMGLIQDQGRGGEVFKMTLKGYEVADMLDE